MSWLKVAEGAWKMVENARIVLPPPLANSRRPRFPTPCLMTKPPPPVGDKLWWSLDGAAEV